MTYEEFKEKFEDLTNVSIIIKEETNYIVFQEDCNTLAEFNKHEGYERLFTINTMRIHDLLDMYDDESYEAMWNTIFDLINTPIKDRYPVKKYHVILDLSHILDEEKCYLNRYTVVNGNIEQWIGTKNEFVFGEETYQTQFTIEEIEEIIPKEDMDKFEIIPFEED